MSLDMRFIVYKINLPKRTSGAMQLVLLASYEIPVRLGLFFVSHTTSTYPGILQVVVLFERRDPDSFAYTTPLQSESGKGTRLETEESDVTTHFLSIIRSIPRVWGRRICGFGGHAVANQSY